MFGVCRGALLQMLAGVLTTVAVNCNHCQLLMLFVGHTNAAEHVLGSLLALPEFGNEHAERSDATKGMLAHVLSHEHCNVSSLP